MRRCGPNAALQQQLRRRGGSVCQAASGVSAADAKLRWLLPLMTRDRYQDAQLKLRLLERESSIMKVMIGVWLVVA